MDTQLPFLVKKSKKKKFGQDNPIVHNPCPTAYSPEKLKKSI
jgi:hypothetical protein